MAEAVVVKSNLVFIRFYAEKAGLESEFIAITTAFRDTQNGQIPCDPEVSFFVSLFQMLTATYLLIHD